MISGSSNGLKLLTRTCSPRASHFLSSRPICTRLKNISLLRFVAASRVSITGLGLWARFGVGDCFSGGGDGML
jgi:hypothetical protein